jgi:putative lipoprotein
MLLKIISILGLVLGAAALVSCGSSSNKAGVTGTVTYRQRIALPPTAVVIVQLQDVSKADAPAEVIGEQVIKTEGKQVPIPFAVPYDPGKIQENHRYSLQARIEDGAGKLLFINDTSIPVITGGSPTQDVEVIVVPVGG